MDTTIVKTTNKAPRNYKLGDVYEHFKTDEPTCIPFLVWFMENPDSPLFFPGQVPLVQHDYIHILLGRGQSPYDEGYVVGYTMGSDPTTKYWHLIVFKFVARYLYPAKYRMKGLVLMEFKRGASQFRRYIGKANSCWRDMPGRGIIKA